ncbi:MAG: hypothetical protein KF726_22955 [Anaerolineae bacterium]|nr:hypothetical protein [Anaerolineae bacterium]
MSVRTTHRGDVVTGDNPMNHVQQFITAFLSLNPSLSEIADVIQALNERAEEIRQQAHLQRLHHVWDTTAKEYGRADAMQIAAGALHDVLIEAEGYLFTATSIATGAVA